MTKISIIMPVYNDSDGLKKSIGSVINQTLNDFELICVNDGSTDDSLAILNDYAEEYDFIRVLSQENQGSGKARNYGIDEARGEYIGFLDADDFFIDNDCLEKLYDAAVKYDANMVSGNIKLVDEEGNFSPFVYLDYFTDFNVILPQEYGIPWSFYKNIFKKDFLVENSIVFPDLLRGQDPVFLAEVLAKVDKIYAVPTDVYAYFYIDGSKQCNTFRKRFDHMMHYKMVFDYLEDEKFDKIRHEFRYQFLGFFDMMGVDAAEDLLVSVREIFKDEPEILKDCEEYFFAKYEHNEDLSNIIEEIRNKHSPRISVISTIRNDGKYLEGSVNTFLSQEFDDFELICINDNSMDNSLEILDKISKKDSRVKIINNENRDFGSSFRKALDMARADYIFFFNPSFNSSLFVLKDLYFNSIINNSDVVLFKINEEMCDLDGLYSYDFDEIIECEDIRRTTFSFKDIEGRLLNTILNPWFKFYKKDFLINNDFIFDTWNPFDYMILHVISILKGKLSFSPVSYYFFKYHKAKEYYNSIDIFKTIDSIKTILIDNHIFDELKDDFEYFEIYQILKYIYSSKSEEYFYLAKQRLEELDYDTNSLPYALSKKYKWVLESDSFKDYQLLKKIDNNSKTNEEFLLRKELYDLNLKQEKLLEDNNSLKKEIKGIKKGNNKLFSSNSWKVTKPLRKFSNLKK